MYTLDDARGEKRYGSVIGACLAATVFCALFGAVYECFSHGVYSYFMIYAFAFPLLMGVVPFFLLWKAGRPFPRRAAAEILLGGVSFLTVGSLVKGILEIYGTTNPLTVGFWISGIVLTAMGWMLALPKRRA